MKIVSYRGVDISSLGVDTCETEFGTVAIDQPINYLDRAGESPLYGGASMSSRSITVVFAFQRAGTSAQIYAVRDRIMALCFGLSDRAQEWPLVAILQSDGVTKISRSATAQSAAFDLQNGILRVVFSSSEARWLAVTPKVVTRSAATGGANQAAPVVLTGSAPPALTIRMKPTGYRVLSSGRGKNYHGYRRQVTISPNGNSASDPSYQYPVQISLGDTSVLVAGGKARADASDVGVVYQGKELPRDLVNWNVAGVTTYLWVLMPFMSQTRTYTVDVIYGSLLGGTVRSFFSASAIPAFDLALSSNAKWVYRVDWVNLPTSTAGHGGWAVTGKTPNYDIPGAWQPAITVENPDNNDSFQQEAVWPYVNGTFQYYMGRFDTKRARPGDTANRDRIADGVVLYNPYGVASVRYDLEWSNTGGNGAVGCGRVQTLFRTDGAQSWTAAASLYTYQASTLVTSVATVASPTGADKFVAFAVWPYDSVAISNTDLGVCRGAWRTTLEVNLAYAPAASAGAEVLIYEIGTELRIGSYDGLPTERLVVGGDTDRRLWLNLNEQLVIDCERRTAEVWNTSLTAKLSDVPVLSVLATRIELVPPNPRVARHWIPVAPAFNPQPNPSFEVNTVGWTAGAYFAPGAAMSWSRDTIYDAGVPGATAGSLKGTITSAASSAQIEISRMYSTALMPIPADGRLSVAASVRTSTVNITPRLWLLLFTASGAAAVDGIDADQQDPVIANTWMRRAVSAVLEGDVAQFQIALVPFANTTGATGNVWFDEIVVNGNDIFAIDQFLSTSLGENMQVDAVWQEGYY